MSVIRNRINATIDKYLKGAENAITRKYAFFTMLKTKGRIVYNDSGESLIWNVRKDLHEMTTNDGSQALQFSSPDLYERATLPWRGYAMTSMIDKQTKMKNKSETALIKLAGERTEMLLEDITQKFSKEPWVNANASGNAQRMHGLQTMFGNNGTLNITTGAQQAYNAADLVGYPNSTYAGINCQPGYYGGAWETVGDINKTWPYGSGAEVYDFWSPVIVNYKSSALAGTAQTWVVQCESAVRRLCDSINGRVGAADGVDMVVLDYGLFTDFKEKLATKERVNTEASTLRRYGILDSFTLDGREIVGDYGVPSGRGFALSMGAVEFRSLQAKMFVADMVDWDIVTRTDRYAIDVHGNFKFKTPKRFGAVADLSA